MADESTKIIIEVGLDPAEYAKRAEEVSRSIATLKKNQDELKKSGQQNSVEYVRNQQQLQVLGRELKSYITLTDESGDAINGYRAQLSLLTAQRNRLSEADRESSEEGKRLTAQILQITNKLKEQEGAVGDNRRNVGNYKQALGDLEGQLGSLILAYDNLSKAEKKEAEGQELEAKIKEVTDAIKEQQEALEKAMAAQEQARVAIEGNTRASLLNSDAIKGLTGSLKDSITNLVPFGSQLQTVVTTTIAATRAIGGTNTALKLFKIALVSTGIGAIVVALGSLVAFLLSTQKGMDLVKQATAGLQAVFRVLADRLVTFGSGIVKLFTGDFSGAVNDFKASFSGIGSEIANEAKQAAGIEGELIKVKRAQEQVNVERAKSRAEIEKLKMVSDDQTKSDAARQAAAKKAYELEQGLLDKQISLKQKELALVKQRNAQGGMTDDRLKEEQDLETELSEVKEESFGKQTELNNKVNELNKARADKAKAYADAEKKLDEERIASLQRVSELTMTARQKEISDLQISFQKRFEQYKDNAKLIAQLQVEYDAQMKAQQKKFQEEDVKTVQDNLKEIQDIRVASIKNEGQRELAELDLQHERRLQAQDDQITELAKRIQAGEKGLDEVWESELKVREAIQTQYDDQRKQLQDNQSAERIAKAQEEAIKLLEIQAQYTDNPTEKILTEQAILDARYQMEIDAAIKLGQDTTAIKAQYEGEKRKLDEETIQTALNSFSSFTDSMVKGFGEQSTAAKIAADIQAKANAIIALSQSAVAVSAGIAAISKAAATPWPANLIAITTTIAALGSGLAAVKTLLSSPGYSGGGQFVSDGRGSVLPGYSKTDNVNARLRSGEGVVVSEAMRDPYARNLISAVNQHFGGRDFSVPGPRPHFASGGIFDGGTFASQATRSADNSTANLAFRLIQGMPAPVVSVKEIMSKSNQVGKVSAKGTI